MKLYHYCIAVLVMAIVFSAMGVSAQNCTLEWRQFDDTWPYDQATKFTLDADENAYVLYGGEGIGIVKYDPDGNEIWNVTRVEDSHSFTDLSLDASGNIFVSGYISNHSNGNVHGIGIWLMKFDQDGNFLWKTLESVYMGTVSPNPILCEHRIDGDGNIYLAGRSFNATIDYRILKYNTNGDLLWGLSAGTGVGDFPTALDLSADGKLAVTGGGFAGFFYTILVDSDGTLLWEQLETAATGALDVAFDPDGNVVAFGSKWDPVTDMDFLALTYSPTGTLLSTQTYDFGVWEGARGFEIDPQGNYIVYGIQSGGYVNWLIAKVHPAGGTYWIATYDQTNDNDEIIYDMTLDAEGNVYATGSGGPTFLNGSFWTLSMVSLKLDNFNGMTLCEHINQTYAVKGVCIIPASGSTFYSLGTTQRTLIKVSGGDSGCTWSAIDENDFESGWGIWNDGGNDCRLDIADATWANSGSYCVRLRDNTSSSVMTTDAMDLSPYSELAVSFSYITSGFDEGESFQLELSSDGGTSYTTLDQWVLGIDFQDDTRGYGLITVEGPFSGSAVLQFRCNASAKNEKVYLDDAAIFGCTSSVFYTLTTQIIGQGSIDPSGGNFAEGTNVSLTATPAPGWQFSSWSNGSLDNPTTVTMNNDISITATFTEVPPGSCTWETISNEDFESGWGIWNDGGNDAWRTTQDAEWANSGVYCIRLQDDSDNSVMTTDPMDWSQYTEAEISFSYYVRNFDGAEDFWLQFSDDGGATYVTVEDWVLGTDFLNNERKFATVNLQGPFSATSVLRFRCNASANDDRVYIDDVILNACLDSGNGLSQNQVSAQPQNSWLKEPVRSPDLVLFPNPATDILMLRFNTPVQPEYARIMDQQGRVISVRDLSAYGQTASTDWKIGTLESGMYYLQVIAQEGQMTRRFVVTR